MVWPFSRMDAMETREEIRLHGIAREQDNDHSPEAIERRSRVYPRRLQGIGQENLQTAAIISRVQRFPVFHS